MEIYICPMCKQENGEHQKYCLNCGTWLLNPTFPAKKKGSMVRKKTGKMGASIVALLLIIGVIWFGLSSNKGTADGKIVFGDVQIGEQFMVTQMEISSITNPSISADFTAKEATTTPLIVSAVFYDENGSRLGTATTSIDYLLSADQTTTIKLDLDGEVNLKNAKNARIEIRQKVN